MDIGARLNQVMIEKSGNNKLAFSGLIGANSNTIQKHITNGTANLEIVEKTLNTFQDISAEWFIRGKGDMHLPKKEDKEPQINKTIEGDNSNIDYNNTDVVKALVETLTQQLKEKDEQIKAKDEQIKALIAKL